MRSPIIVALDFDSLEAMQTVVAQLNPQLCRVKIGSILFTRYGAPLIETLQKKGFDVFLDLKFHDIPATVAGACRAAADLNVWMLTVHASGGLKMLAAAHEAVINYKKPPLIVAVTALTSLSAAELKALQVNAALENWVKDLALSAKQAQLNGVVCSAHEVALLRPALPKDFLLVTPGIRLADDNHFDQARVMTPIAAMQAGANYLVIGRPITQAKNPAQVLESIIASLPK